MSTEAWKDSGNCKECRRAKYCNKPCSANKKRLQKILEISARAAIGKMMIRNGHKDAEEARSKLEVIRRNNNEDCSTEAIDALFERCRLLATHSKYTISQIVNGVIGTAMSTGDSTDEVLRKMEDKYETATLKGY